ncbi:hypothetical protein R6Z07F_013149 [Ovis aries]
MRVDNDYLSPIASLIEAWQIEVGVQVGRGDDGGSDSWEDPAHLSLPLASSPRHVCISDSGQQCRPRLAYDGAHHLSAMCLRSEAWGGGFSGDPQDDFHGPDGSLLPNTETLHSAGRTWAPQVSHSITGPVPLYSHNRVSWYQSLASCGLTAHNWPFQACDEPARAEIHHVHNLRAPGGSGRSCVPG